MPASTPSSSISPSASASISNSPSASASSSLSASPSASPSPSGTTASPTASPSSSPSPSTFNHNADNDVWLEVVTDEDDGDADDREVYAPRAVGTISGTLYAGTLAIAPVLSAVGTISATYIPPIVVSGLLQAYAKLSMSDPVVYFTYYRNHIVGWSKIGDTRILVDESNEAGYQPLLGDITAQVFQILSMKNKFAVVYTADGVFVMEPVSQPAATFAIHRISQQGVMNVGTVCGCDDKHWFIADDYTLYMVAYKADFSRPQVQSLGYNEFMELLAPNGQHIMMHYDKINDRVYISSTRGGYILTDAGLGGGYSRITAADGEIFASPVAIVSPSQLLVTDTLDMGYRGQKTIMEVMVAANLTETMSVAIDYRFDKSEDFRTSEYKRCNKEGVVFPIVAGIDFRVRVKTDTYDDFNIDYISVKFKYTDVRYNRGQFAA